MGLQIRLQWAEQGADARQQSDVKDSLDTGPGSLTRDVRRNGSLCYNGTWMDMSVQTAAATRPDAAEILPDKVVAPTVGVGDRYTHVGLWLARAPAGSTGLAPLWASAERWKPLCDCCRVILWPPTGSGRGLGWNAARWLRAWKKERHGALGCAATHLLAAGEAALPGSRRLWLCSSYCAGSRLAFSIGCKSFEAMHPKADLLVCPHLRTGRWPGNGRFGAQALSGACACSTEFKDSISDLIQNTPETLSRGSLLTITRH